MILVIDNYDSFTFNLVQALQASGARVEVVRNDRIDRDGLAARLGGDAAEPLRGLVISPGPGDPRDAGISVAAIELAAEREVPVLGVCLGHQCLAAAYGGRIVRAPTLVHGEASQVNHEGEGLLAGLPSPFPAARYHSLCVDEASLPAEIEITARTDDGVVMAMRHRSLPLEGVQFHPESVLTPEGPRLLANFLRRIGEGDAGILEEQRGFATRGLATAGAGR
jgi:anthranilate synthase/aminodeoxychorismate synthase-like glutamine amidotransferase